MKQTAATPPPAGEASTSSGRAILAAAREQGPLPRDNMLNHIKAFGRLAPDERKALLTEKGARQRVRQKGIMVRQSLAYMPRSPSLQPSSAASTPATAACSMVASAGGSAGPSPLPSPWLAAAPGSSSGTRAARGKASSSAAAAGAGSATGEHADGGLAPQLAQFNKAELVRLSMPSDLYRRTLA